MYNLMKQAIEPYYDTGRICGADNAYASMHSLERSREDTGCGLIFTAKPNTAHQPQFLKQANFKRYAKTMETVNLFNIDVHIQMVKTEQ